MKTRISYYKEQLLSVEKKIQEDLVKYFNEVQLTPTSGDFQIIELNSEEDIRSVYSGPGFYVIFTDHSFPDNISNFSYKSKKAIYRGHCHTVKKRINSHLANENYKLNNSYYDVCLKVNPGENGININQIPYKNWGWTVIVYKMRGSSKVIREQAELAFDTVFGKPCKSREK